MDYNGLPSVYCSTLVRFYRFFLNVLEKINNNTKPPPIFISEGFNTSIF